MALPFLTIPRKTLKKIEGAMIILALDDTRPLTREEISWSTWVGDGQNRWFDKHQCKPPFLNVH
jgi:hypothetical protein